MDLSVIIVNYNVKHFLEQCLHSVLKASKNIASEIFVVDNNSVDGSTQLIHEKFSEINFIKNTENLGFSRANNQAIARSKGKYILLLNPDTVVEEDTFKKALAFMEVQPKAGGLGVKMIDGKGTFLPESKRGLPTPWVAFYKIFGLSNLFPKSKKFGRYHLSYLNKDEIQEVDVLAGAFMLLRKSVLDKVGMLDESFFMYGEDIDLSYRIQRAGYTNYYFPETTIIHYKGESTKKASLNYVKVFYKAMIIFAKKHFPGGKAGVFAFLIQVAIYFRAMLSAAKRIIEAIYLPVVDGLIVFLGFAAITPLWATIRFSSPNYYPDYFLPMVVPVYILFFLFGIKASGGYKKPIKPIKIIRGIGWGLASLLLAYSLMDEKYRFSRALILMGGMWSVLLIPCLRFILHALKLNAFRLDRKQAKKMAIVGHSKEADRVQRILEDSQAPMDLMGYISPDKSDNGINYMGTLNQIKEIISINRIDELIFCAEDLSSAEIIKTMLNLTSFDVEFKIAPPKSISIIGSNSIHTAGELYVVDMNAISKSSNRRKKRLFDFAIALLFLSLSPVSIWFYKQKRSYISNVLNVITGNKSWIGYLPCSDLDLTLPELRQGILNTGDILEGSSLTIEKKVQLNMNYAKDYRILTDAEILFKCILKTDR